MMRIEIKGLNKVADAYRNAPEVARHYLQRALDASAATLAKNTKKHDPVPWRTGFLLQSFRERITPGAARWYPTAPYALYVDQGTRPHTIRVKRAKVLADEKTGRVFGKMVHHPGIRPRRYMEKIAIKSVDEIRKHFNDAAEKIVRAVGR